jgi:RHS repeat-associated protein
VADQLFTFDAKANQLCPGADSVLYSGEHFDAKSNQQYLRARFYDPSTGRFNRLDPYKGHNSDPQSLHKYQYAHGDPVSNDDPSGRFSVPAFSVGNAMRFGLAGMTIGAVVGFGYGAAEARIAGATWTQAFQHGVVTGLWGGVLGFFAGIVWFGVIAREFTMESEVL